MRGDELLYFFCSGQWEKRKNKDTIELRLKYYTPQLKKRLHLTKWGYYIWRSHGVPYNCPLLQSIDAVLVYIVTNRPWVMDGRSTNFIDKFWNLWHSIRQFRGGRIAIVNKILLFFYLLTYLDEQHHQLCVPVVIGVSHQNAQKTKY